MSGRERYEGPRDSRAAEFMTPDYMRQVQDMRKWHEARTGFTSDTSTRYIPAVHLHDPSRHDSIVTNGGRKFDVGRDGSINYRVTRKDERGLYDMTTDYLTERDRRRPTQQEVRDFTKKIAQINGIQNINQVKVGTELRIPGKIVPGYADRYQPDSDERYEYPSSERSPYDYERRRGMPPPDKAPTTDMIQPKGTQEGNHPDVLNRKVQDFPPDHYGNQTIKYNGELRDGFIGGVLSDTLLDLGQGRTKFDAEDKKDRYGRLLERNVSYSNQNPFGRGGIDMKIPNSKGGETTVEVKHVQIKYNELTGRYDTTLISSKGERFHVQTDREGKPLIRK